MTTYNVTNAGSGAYIINGASNPPLNLIRGSQYTFSVNAVGHPFWIQTTTIPYNATNVYNSGITNNGTQSGNLVFNVPLDAPNTLYYVCQFHNSMNGTINITDDPIVCYAKGTLILTKRGYVPIENIRSNNKVITKGKIYDQKYIKTDANEKAAPVIWISKFKVKNMNSKSRPICIKKDALGENYPFQDLYVSPNHRLLLNGQMVTSKNIVNGKTIYQDNECKRVEYYHLECEDHNAIYANGVLAESYIDVDNRRVFENSTKTSPKLNIKR